MSLQMIELMNQPIIETGMYSEEIVSTFDQVLNMVQAFGEEESMGLNEEQIRFMLDARSMFYTQVFGSEPDQEEDMMVHSNIVYLIPKKKNYTDKNDCSICLSQRKRTLQRTDCGHTFCTGCSEQHFKNKDTCPMCRATVSTLTKVYYKKAKK